MLSAEVFLHRTVFIDLVNYQLILVIVNLTVLQCFENVAVDCVVKGQKFKIEVLLNILGRSWQVVQKYSLGSPES